MTILGRAVLVTGFFASALCGACRRTEPPTEKPAPATPSVAPAARAARGAYAVSGETPWSRHESTPEIGSDAAATDNPSPTAPSRPALGGLDGGVAL